MRQGSAPSPEQEDLDFELLTIPAETAEGEEDSDPLPDFSDLDALLAESTKLASARKAKVTGRKLSPEQVSALDSAQAQADRMLWTGVKAFAHVAETLCSCGCRSLEFRGWYHFEVQPRGTGKRLIRRDGKSDLPSSLYLTQTLQSQCVECLPPLPVAGLADCDLLQTLGTGLAQTPQPSIPSIKTLLEEIRDEL